MSLESDLLRYPHLSWGEFMSETIVGRNVPIDVLVSKLRALPENAFHELEQVRQLLRSKPVDPSSIERYLCWDTQHYTRNLIDKTDTFELMAICWEIGQVSRLP